jgi:hypothetical protein
VSGEVIEIAGSILGASIGVGLLIAHVIRRMGR